MTYSGGFWAGPDAEAKVEQLKKLMNDGLSFSQIANAMGAVSRNVVLCKANRLGLSKPADGNVTRLYARKERDPKPPPPVIPPPELLVPALIDGEPVTLENILDGMCRYPLDGDDLQYCGNATPDKRARYCSMHHKICLRPNQKNRAPAKPYSFKATRQFSG
jgi:GcrA cell cycle regulator